jgi:hypothetical protein
LKNKKTIEYTKTEVKGMSKKTPNEDNTVILSDKYLSESGVQGGKIIAEHLALGCFLVGIPLFIIGLFSLLFLVSLRIRR